MATRKVFFARLLLVLGLVTLVSLLFLTGWNDLVRDRDRFGQVIRDAGAWGPVVYVLLMTCLVAVGVPGVAFVVPASMIWTAPVAVAVFLAGGMAASSVRFGFVRSVGRDWVEPRLPVRFRSWDYRFSSRGFRNVVMLRLLFNLAAPADWLLALSQVTTLQFLVGTLVGRTPVAIVLVLAAGGVAGWLADAPGEMWMVLVISAFGAGVAIRLRRSR